MIRGMDLTRLPSYMTMSAAAEQLSVDAATVGRWIRAGRLRAHMPVQARRERPLMLLWKPDVDRMAEARLVVTGMVSEPNPCASGCQDPEMHAEGGHDV